MDTNKVESINTLELLPHFGRYSVIAGILLMILGMGGVILPQFMSLETNILIASLFLIGGIFWIIHLFKANNNEWSEWLKSVLLLISGGLMMFYPMTGIATIGLLLAIYLLMDAYSSFYMSYNLRHKDGWVWMAVNGLVSLLLAALFLTGWPASSLWLVGLYVSISLFFDGMALLLIAWTEHKTS